MTLHRQIVLLIASLLFVVLTTVLVISTYNTRSLLSKQLTLHTQGTADSLGLILSAPVNKSKQNMCPLVTSILDSGFYSAVQVFNDNRKMLLKQSVEHEIKGVPKWFMSLFPFPESSTQASATTLNGKVIVTAFTGLIYADFWYETTCLFWAMAVLYVLSCLLSYYVVKRMLHPLSVLKRQADEINNNQFSLSTTEPKAHDLHHIGQAMNHLAHNTQMKYDEEKILTQRLQQQTYQDPVTGLGNRRYFDTQINHLISEHIVLGALFLIEIKGLKEYNDKMGYQVGDQLIKQIAEVLKENSQDVKANFLSRIGGSTFAILAPHLGEEEITHLANCLIHALETLLQSNKETKSISVHIGIASFADVKVATKALTLADIALKTAQSKGDFAYFHYENAGVEREKITSRNASEWKKYIDQVIADNLVMVAYQPIMSIPDKTMISNEALLRIKGTESDFTEARFIIPLADRYGLTYALDRCVINQVLEKIQEKPTKIPYSINISANTLGHEETMQWLYKHLATGEYRDQLIFELDEHTLLNNGQQVKEFAKKLKQYGAALAVEHYGHDFSGFDSLKNLNLVYLKIDGSYIRDLGNQDTQFYINFLAKVAHTLGVKVIAECLETEDQWKQLHSYQLDGAQGHYLAMPEQQ